MSRTARDVVVARPRRGPASSRALALLVAMLAAGVGVVAVTPRAEADDADTMLERARHAAATHDFVGSVQIEWLDQGVWHTAQVPVASAGGTVVIGSGGGKATGTGSMRSVRDDAGWNGVWNVPSTGAVPAASRRWRLSVSEGPDLVGRATEVVSARDPRTGVLRMRLGFDRATGLLTRREVLDRHGRSVRVVALVGLVEKSAGTTATSRAATPRESNAPQRVDTLATRFRPPSSPPTGFQLAGTYRRDDGAIQLFYSDGLFDVSVFEQGGELDWSALPSGGRDVAVDGQRARAYATSSGTILVWQHGAVAFTCVSDAPLGDLTSFASAFNRAPRDAGGGGVLRDISDFVLGPFGWN